MNVQQARQLKTGQPVRYTGEGPDCGSKGTITKVTERFLYVTFDDGEETDWRLDRGDFHLRNLELTP